MICWKKSNKKDYVFQLGVIFYLLLLVSSLLPGNILVESNAKKTLQRNPLECKANFWKSKLAFKITVPSTPMQIKAKTPKT